MADRSYPNLTVKADEVVAFKQSKEFWEMNSNHRALLFDIKVAVLNKNINEVIKELNSYAREVNAASIPYRPKSTNSNAYAFSAIERITGKRVPSDPYMPGSGVKILK